MLSFLNNILFMIIDLTYNVQKNYLLNNSFSTQYIQAILTCS